MYESSCTVKELKAAAKAAGIPKYYDLRKIELLTVLNAQCVELLAEPEGTTPEIESEGAIPEPEPSIPATIPSKILWIIIPIAYAIAAGVWVRRKVNPSIPWLAWLLTTGKSVFRWWVGAQFAGSSLRPSFCS